MMPIENAKTVHRVAENVAAVVKTSPQNNPVPPLDPRKLLSTIADNTQHDAMLAFVEPGCTPVEMIAGVKICPVNDKPHTGERAAFYAQLFNKAFGHAVAERQTFDQDMARLDKLLASAENLASMTPPDQIQAAFLRERTSHIRSEIMRIDRRYATFNLLRLLPMGVKAIKGLKQRADS